MGSSVRAELADLPQGWCHHGEQLLALLERAQPRVTVELGSWRGASAIAFARLVRTWGGVVYCVDTWMGDVNGGTKPGTPMMLTEFAGNLTRAGVAANVRIIPALTVDAARWWCGPPIDCLYVDADHTQASCAADLEAWWPHVAVGGLVAGDDYDNPMYPGVKAAWDTFEWMHGQHFQRVPTPNTQPPGMSLIFGVKELV